MTTNVAYESPDEPSVAVIEALAAELGDDPLQLGVQLNDFVDPDALDALFAPRYDGTERRPGRIEFTMLGCTVTVYGTGTVTVEQTSEYATSSPRTDSSRSSG